MATAGENLITDNCGPIGSLDVDIDEHNRHSDKVLPPLAVFGRQVRDCLPILPGKYNPYSTWRELLQPMELVMAKAKWLTMRHAENTQPGCWRQSVCHKAMWTYWYNHSARIMINMWFMIQNKINNFPTWHNSSLCQIISSPAPGLIADPLQTQPTTQTNAS